MGTLYVMTATLTCEADVHGSLRAMRQMQGGAQTMLLLADLPDSDAVQCAQDAPLIRAAQSGVMAMNARRPGRFALLVRRRAWDDAARRYLGAAQATPPERVVAELLTHGRTQTAFEGATLAPGALASQGFDAILFAPASLCCTPDTPDRMRAALGAEGCVGASVVLARQAYPPLYARLLAQGFDISMPHTALTDALARRGLTREGPALYTPDALCRHFLAPNPVQPVRPLAPDCRFVQCDVPSLAATLDRARQRLLQPWTCALPDGSPTWLRTLARFCGAGEGVVPLAQLLLLALAAGGGWVLPVVLAALPALYAALHPRLLPGALVRVALLPLWAAHALDALCMRHFARSPRFALCVPPALLSVRACPVWGMLLLTAALLRPCALVPLMAISLLWLGAPLLMRALALPARERIPLTAAEQARLCALAADALCAIPPDADPALRMLAECARCQLGEREPDEAARHIQRLLPLLTADAAPSATSHAAALVSAQYLREHMGACDAALRPLPEAIEAACFALPAPVGDGFLAAMLRAARGAAFQPAEVVAAEALEALFLPEYALYGAPSRAALQPLTHPHGFLLTARDVPAVSSAPDALILADAALCHPFAALLWRCPHIAPYAAAVWA